MCNKKENGLWPEACSKEEQAAACTTGGFMA